MERRRFIQLTGMLAAAPAVVWASSPRLVVIGGGYGGVVAARRLKRQAPAAEVILISRDRHYLSGTGGNFVLIGEWPPSRIRHDYGALEREGIRLIYAAVERVDSQSITLAEGQSLRYDHAIVAPGIDFDYHRAPEPGAALAEKIPHAFSGETAVLRRQLQDMRDNGTVIIIPPPSPSRCSPAPYERASLIAHWMERRHPRGKVLILDPKESFAQQTLFDEAWNAHYRDRLEWRSAEAGGWVEAIDVKRRSVITEFDEEAADVINYIPPQRAAALAIRSGLTDDSGWCPVETTTFRSVRLPRVHIVGDAARLMPAPKAGNFAVAQATRAADAIIAELNGRPLPETGEMLDYSCYSYITPDYAFVENGRYRTAAGGLEKVNITLSPRGLGSAAHSRTAAEGGAHYRRVMRRLFG